MRPSERRRKYKVDDELSPSERRERIESGEWIEEEDEEEEVKKAPIGMRLLAWISLIAIFFAVGYAATSLMFKWMDRGGGKHPSNLVATPQETKTLIAKTKSADEIALSENVVVCTLSIPEGDAFVTRQIRCRRGLREDNIQETLSAYLDAVKEGKLLDPAAASLNLFQSGEWLYLNMNGSFLTSLKTLGANKSSFLLTGLVKTMSDNFSPIGKVKFYIDGSEPKGKDPVDLSMPWSLLSGRS